MTYWIVNLFFVFWYMQLYTSKYIIWFFGFIFYFLNSVPYLLSSTPVLTVSINVVFILSMEKALHVYIYIYTYIFIYKYIYIYTSWRLVSMETEISSNVLWIISRPKVSSNMGLNAVLENQWTGSNHNYAYRYPSTHGIMSEAGTLPV